MLPSTRWVNRAANNSRFSRSPRSPHSQDRSLLSEMRSRCTTVTDHRDSHACFRRLGLAFSSASGYASREAVAHDDLHATTAELAIPFRFSPFGESRIRFDREKPELVPDERYEFRGHDSPSHSIYLFRRLNLLLVPTVRAKPSLCRQSLTGGRQFRVQDKLHLRR
jgi:hypothetical protein